MPLDTYAGLTARISDYLERDDMGPFIPDWVRLAEVRLDRRLNLGEGEASVTLPLVAGVTPLPDDYRAWRSVTGAGWGGRLDYLSPDQFYSYRRGSWRSYWRDQYGVPHYDGPGGCGFTIVGSVPADDLDAPLDSWSFGADNPFLLVGPSSAGSVRLIYRRGIPPIGKDRPTNWLLSKAPDLYLYASLLEAEPFLHNDARITTWRSLMEEALKDVSAVDRDARWGRTRFRLSGPTP